ncbi:unnamed protein product [Cyprideis torosa]|uniref:Uncharacterized protein n=1 Tax=Cyprideis torosa TaxID=163714 RepID=A0A7R8W3P5_9CRUS|nr:unnamed protein product [Cyprideis torosa]CAG0883219.1 unnamed protein product [Cyprideis torosa]
MFRLCLLLAISALAYGRNIQTPQKEFINRIVGGDATTIENYPYIVSLRTSGNFHFCAGSILNTDWIVTAAHCVVGNRPSEQVVVAGSTYIGQGNRLEVAQVKWHEDYSSSTFENDIALLRLATPLEWSDSIQGVGMAPDSDQNAVRVPSSNSQPPSFSEYGPLEVMGWGRLADGTSPEQLQYVEVPFVNDELCRDAYGQGDIADHMICAGEANKDSCQGDSGGPIVNQVGGTTQVGIVSWGYGCGVDGFPGVYTEVAYFNDWIRANVNTKVNH